jgi:hypothetical protein
MGRGWPVVGPQGTRGSSRRPESKTEHDRCGGERPERQDEGVKGQACRGLGNASLADGSEWGQRGGHGHRTDSTTERHNQVSRHTERDQLAPIGTEGCHCGIVLALGNALAGNCLADDRQTDESG